VNTTGYIKVWRQILESEVFEDAGIFHLFVALLLRATHQRIKALLKIGKQCVVVELNPGECAIRTRLIAQDLKISDKTLRRRLAVLQDLECIESTTTSKYIKVKIPNWERYQVSPEGGSKFEPLSEQGAVEITAPSTAPSTAHNKKGRRKEVRGARTRFQKPTVEEVREYVTAKGYAIDPVTFISHYNTVGWLVGKNRAPMKNWQAAVVTWVQRDKQRNGQSAKSQYQDL
jgi:hypothetical protein